MQRERDCREGSSVSWELIAFRPGIYNAIKSSLTCVAPTWCAWLCAYIWLYCHLPRQISPSSVLISHSNLLKTALFPCFFFSCTLEPLMIKWTQKYLALTTRTVPVRHGSRRSQTNCMHFWFLLDTHLVWNGKCVCVGMRERVQAHACVHDDVFFLLSWS